MNKLETKLILVDSATKHFGDEVAIELSDQEQTLYKYKVARDAALFFDKERKKLLDDLTKPFTNRIAEDIATIIKNDSGMEYTITDNDVYNLHVKMSAPPNEFQKDKLHEAIKRTFPEATPMDLQDVINICMGKGTPRKTFTVI